MKEQKIEWVNTFAARPEGYMYDTGLSTMLMSWISAPEDGVCKQLTGQHTCRETFIRELRNLYLPAESVSGKLAPIDTKKLRISISRKKVYSSFRRKDSPTGPEKTRRVEELSKFVVESDAWMKRAKRCLNLFEKRAGWLLTNVKKASDDNDISLAHRGTAVYIFTASPRWMRSPQLLSLYLLIVRLCRSEIMQSITSCEDVSKLVNLLEFKKVMTEGSRNPLFGDFKHLQDTHKYWATLIDNYKQLFGNADLRKTFNENDSQDGITKLSILRVGSGQLIKDNDVYKKWESIVKTA